MSFKYRFNVFIFFLGIISLLLGGCSLHHRMNSALDRTFKKSDLLKKYHSGFALFDPVKNEMIYERNGKMYFTPASNTKLYTFYAALKMIPEDMPALRYIEKGDSLIFWGTGDPAFLQSRLKDTTALGFLKASPKKLFFAPNRYSGNFYGAGWQWDDYNDYYQAEINELPLMDNLVKVKVSNGKMQVSPKLFESSFMLDTLKKKQDFLVQRAFRDNKFYYPGQAPKEGYEQEIPYRVSIETTIRLLADTLHKDVQMIDMQMPEGAKTLYGMKRDSVLREMLLPSDNFIAEQLLLVCSDRISAELSTSKTIAYMEKNGLAKLPDQPVWVDGSGLSRGNLFTPEDMIAVLRLIYQEVNNREKLFSMLPAGGKRGTLRNAYPKTDHPFIFGKTGTLSNNHNQSGFVVTRKGKMYIYAFMNNNFIVPVSQVRGEMGRIMTYIHEKF